MTPIKNKNENFIYKDLTYKTIGCAMEVHKSLGVGFLESVYEAALIVEFKRSNLPFESQVELKAIKQITDFERAQSLNYLKVAKLRIGLLINFGSNSLQYERIIL